MTFAEFLADVVMVLHAGFSVFVVLGLAAIIVGLVLGWKWTRNRGFQLAHLAAILFLVVRVWVGLPCPLSAAENWLRHHTTSTCILGGTFHKSLHRLAFRGANENRFTLGTTVVGVLGMGAFLLNNRAAYRARTFVTSRHGSVTDL